MIYYQLSTIIHKIIRDYTWDIMGHHGTMINHDQASYMGLAENPLMSVEQ